MKKRTFYLLLAAVVVLILASCKSLYPGNYSKYSWHGQQLKKQIDSLYKTDTTGKCVVAMIKGRLVLICR